MKQVLIVLESSLLREYLRAKLEENGVAVSVAIASVDGISKMRSLMPDLIILDYLQDRESFMELLRQKKQDPNSSKTPVVVFAQEIEQRQLLELLPYNVKKVFNKPIKIDALFAALSEILLVPFNIDSSPGIVEVHVNESVIFVEIAFGLNSDKLDILRYKITELMDMYKIRMPRVIILLSDIKLSFSDAPNMQKLLDTVVKASRVKLNYVRIITNDDFVRQFINSKREYEKIEVASDLQLALDGLLTGIGDEPYEKAEIIGDRILAAKSAEDEALLLRFDADGKKENPSPPKSAPQNLKIAVIDEDPLTEEMIRNTFRISGALVSAFRDGGEFLNTLDTREFDLVFLEIHMSGMDGFEVVETMRKRNINYPVIMLSALNQREMVLKAIGMGIKSYLVKPLKSEDIFLKSMEILKADF